MTTDGRPETLPVPVPPAPIAARRVAALLAAWLVVLASAAPALAHAELASATPGPDVVVVGSPTELVATFTESIDPGRSSILVVASDGATVAEGGADETSADGLTMTVALPTLDPGPYEVRWTAVATDGHVERGTYAFTVEAAPSPSPSPTPSPEPSADPSPSPSPGPSPSPSPAASLEPGEPASGVDPLSVALPILIVAVIVGIVAVWWTRRRAA